jgi:hypothetical protein
VGVEPTTSANVLCLYLLLEPREMEENNCSNPTRSTLFSLQAPYPSVPSTEVLRKSARVVK